METVLYQDYKGLGKVTHIENGNIIFDNIGIIIDVPLDLKSDKIEQAIEWLIEAYKLKGCATPIPYNNLVVSFGK